MLIFSAPPGGSKMKGGPRLLSSATRVPYTAGLANGSPHSSGQRIVDVAGGDIPTNRATPIADGFTKNVPGPGSRSR